MSLKRTASAAAIAISLGLGVGAAAFAQTPIGTLGNANGVTISGAVTDVFGNKFVVEDATGRVLVETGPAWHSRVQMTVGETVTVVGEPGGDGFDAFSIQRGNGEVITIREPGRRPAWAGGPDRERHEHGPRNGAADPAVIDQVTRTLADAGFGSPRLDEVKGRHIEFTAEAAPGVIVEINTYRDGSLRDIEADDDQASRADLGRLLPEALRTSIAAEGVSVIEEVKFRDRHIEVEGQGADGAEVELRLATADYALQSRGVPPQDVALPDDAALRAAVEQAGYTWSGVADRKPRHAEVRATNPEGETVIVHVDASGAIYREVAVR